MATLFKDGYFQPNDTVGRTLGGAKLYFYTAGTTSPKNTYTSSALTATNQHPVEADAAGRFPPVWLEGTYDVELKDSDDVLIDSWENVNNTDSAINATAPLQFKTLADLKTLTAQNDVVVDPEIGDALHTTGKTNTQDDEGADWVVVAAGTGTPDDDTYVDLSNGLQAERIFNNLYRKNNGSDIENAATFRSNISAIEDGTGTVSNTNLASNSVTTTKIASNAVTNDKVANDAVDTANLVDASVTSVKLGDESVTPSKIQPADAGTTNIILRLQSATTSTTATSYLDAGTYRGADNTRHLGFTCLNSGEIRISAEYRAASNDAFIRFLKNGTELSALSTSSSTFQSAVRTETVSVGDVVIIQLRTSGSAEWRNLQVSTDTEVFVVA